MRKFFIFIFVLLLVFFLLSHNAYAVVDPRTVPNNKVGIHILFPDEISEAASLVNSNGGDWGYVTIPIQAGDRDLEKWQTFMDKCKSLHVIPLLRLATEGDYFNTKVWRRPDYADILDFANFLNSLNWPTRNRYIIVFNEPNRADEWGGEVNPSEYAQLLSYAVTTFKSKNQDFFILSAGLDNAASDSSSSEDEYTYLAKMDQEVPGIFYQIDGIASHSYPNPGFSKSPLIQDSESIASFKFEREFIKNLGSNDLPVFITETGWSSESVSDEQIASYYPLAFNTVWSDPSVVSVNPFLLRANSGPFTSFSFLRSDSSQSKEYAALASLSKAKGSPSLSQEVLAEHKIQRQPAFELFPTVRQTMSTAISIPSILKITFKWLLKI